MVHLKLEVSVFVSGMHSPMSFHLFASVLEVSVVMNCVHSSVLLYEGKVVALALPVDIERANLVLTLTANRCEVNDQHQLHVVVLVKLLVVAVPSVRHARLLLSIGLLLSVTRLTILLHSLWRVAGVTVIAPRVAVIAPGVSVIAHGVAEMTSAFPMLKVTILANKFRISTERLCLLVCVPLWGTNRLVSRVNPE